MKDSELQFDRSCHALYSKQCKKQIQAKIALHYPENRRESVWEEVQKNMLIFSPIGARISAERRISTTGAAVHMTA